MALGNLGEIKIFAFDFVPPDYMICDGRRLNKSQYQFLYLVIGNTYTYDTSDEHTFAIPDLRDRFVKHPGTEIHLGERKGANEAVLSIDQMPEHNHQVTLEVDNTKGGDEISSKPNGAFLNNNASVFSTDPSSDTFLGGISQQNVGNSNPIPIKNASVKMVYAIRFQGESENSGFIGQIKIWPNSNTNGTIVAIPKGWKLCNGDFYSIATNSALGTIIGFKYGTGNDGNPKLPDFRNRYANGAENANKIAETGGNTSIRLNMNNLPSHKHNVNLAVNNDNESTQTQVPNNAFINKNAGPFSQEIASHAILGGVEQRNVGGQKELDITNSSLGLNYIICVEGIMYPTAIHSFMGEILMYAGFDEGFLNGSGLSQCRGQKLPINQQQTLYTLLHNHYGGNGSTNFNLPDLRNKIPLCISSLIEIGKSTGANKIKLTPENLPEHNHSVQLAANHSGSGTKVEIPNAILNKDAGPFSIKESENSFLAGIKEHDFSREAEPIDLRNPFLTINYLIAIEGEYPSRELHND